MAGYCTSAQLYFHVPQASENTAQECNIKPYYLLNHQIIDLLYTTLILVASRKQIATAHVWFKGRFVGIMPSSSVIKAYSLFQQRLRVHSNQSTCHGCYEAYAPGAIEYGLSNMGKYQSCWSIGNTMGEYTRYIIKECTLHLIALLLIVLSSTMETLGMRPQLKHTLPFLNLR